MDKKLVFGYFFAINLFLAVIIFFGLGGFHLYSSENVRNFFQSGETLSMFNYSGILQLLFFVLFSMFFYILLVFRPVLGMVFGLSLPILNFLFAFIVGGESGVGFLFLSYISLIYWGISILIVLILSKTYNNANFFYKKVIIISSFCVPGLLAVIFFVREPLNLSTIANFTNNPKLCSFAGKTEEPSNDVTWCYNALGIKTNNSSLCVNTNGLDGSCLSVTQALSFGNIDEIKIFHMKNLYDEYFASQGRVGKNYVVHTPHNAYEYFLYRDDKKYRGDILIGNDGKDDFIYCYDVVAGDPEGIVSCIKSIEPLFISDKNFKNLQLTKLYKDNDILKLNLLNYIIEIFNKHQKR